ncbi:DUF11 domain-containing protein [Candidatus Saccharibacteria bacterium]|nr:DUF11 domain-containing protein [Candidatus Saccharibacteria bacterium]
MFNKLLSNLPFNPSLIDQVSFYAKRLHKEAGIRRLGFGLIAMTMVVQLFAVISPAQASLSCDPSGNDIIQCGFKTKEEAVNLCNSNNRGFGTILLHHGLTCDMLASAQDTTIRTTDYGNRLRSVGRKAFNKPGETSQNIPEVGNLFWRPLSSWGTFSTRVLKTQTNDGQLVMVMFECGNLVKLDDFELKQPAPDSSLQVNKSNNPTGEVKSGDIIEYTLAFTNKGGDAAFFSVNDILPDNLTYVTSSHGNWTLEQNGQSLRWHNGVPPFYVFGNTDAFGTPGFITIKAKVNNNIPSGTTICNRAFLQDVPKGGSNTRNSSEVQVCNTVIVPCPNGQQLGDDRLTCKEIAVSDAACLSLSSQPVSGDKTKKKFLFTSKASAVNGATIQNYTYDFGDGTKYTNQSDNLEDSIEHSYSETKTYDITVTVKTSIEHKASLTCQTKVSIQPEDKSPTLQISKSASNITKNIVDANGTTVNAGDTIEYTLTTRNVSDVDAVDIILQPEDLGDVLEYATLDMTTLQGGIFDQETKVLAWNDKTTIKSGESVNKIFRVTVKNPIPSTPSPDTTNKSVGDLVMHNWYGNAVDIKLPGTPVKIIEQTTTTTLPNTGPGTSLLIGFIVFTITGYFFARSRLLATELDIVKNEYTTANGGY